MLYKLIVLLTSSVLGWPQADVDEHIAALKDTDLAGRIRAAKALEKLGPKAEPAIPALINGLKDYRGEDINIRVGTLCAKALVAIGKPGHDAILESLKSDNVLVFTGAAQGLTFMKPPPPEALDALFDAVRQRNSDTSKGSPTRQRGWVATEVLANYGKQAQPVEFQFIKMLASDNFREQVSAAKALAAIGPDAHRAVPALIKLTKEGNASARSHAAMTLSIIGPVKDIDIVEPIATLTGDYSAVVRERALESLGRLGPKAKAVLPRVEELLRKKTFNNRIDAAVAVFRISGDAKEPVEVLVELAKTTEVELEAIQALGKVGPAAKASVPELIKMLESKDADKRFEIVQTLKQVAPTNPRVVWKLDRLAKSDPDAAVRRISKLLKSKDKPAVSKEDESKEPPKEEPKK